MLSPTPITLPQPVDPYEPVDAIEPTNCPTCRSGLQPIEPPNEDAIDPGY
jgi:hypothetical protein